MKPSSQSSFAGAKRWPATLLDWLVCWFCLLYLSIYLPLAAMIYLPTWYQVNCQWHPRCEMIGMPTAQQGIAELTRYFRHQGELLTRWTAKERSHLAEVRQIYDGMFVIAWLAVIGLVWRLRPANGRSAALVNLGLLAAMLAVLPVFKPFWQDFLHPLLFDNLDWKNNRDDLSYYIMPRRFFLHSTAALIGAAALLNVLTWQACRHWYQPARE